MLEHLDPVRKSPDTIPARPFLDDRETHDFLRAHGIQRLDIAEWKPGEPLLYVLTSEARAALMQKGFTEDTVPSIVRLSGPTAIETALPNGAGKIEYLLDNAGAPIDFYTIDRATGDAKIVYTNHKVTTNDNPYVLEEGTFYRDADELFPPSTQSLDA